MDEHIIELRALSKLIRDDMLQNSAKIDALIDVFIEKEEIDDAYFYEIYETKLHENHQKFKKQLDENSNRHVEQPRHNTLDETLEDILTSLSEEEIKAITLRYSL